MRCTDASQSARRIIKAMCIGSSNNFCMHQAPQQQQATTGQDNNNNNNRKQQNAVQRED
jgi:hypothetical protein